VRNDSEAEGCWRPHHLRGKKGCKGTLLHGVQGALQEARLQKEKIIIKIKR